MKLIAEQSQDVEYLIEKDETNNGKKTYFIEGRFMVADEGNLNGRKYPKRVLENALKKYQTLIKEKQSLGELNHPKEHTINLDKVSHLITELYFDKNAVMGKAKVLPTPMGEIVKAYLDEGIKIGVSSRGLGSLKESNGLMEVQSDFSLVTVDVVHNPSGPGCFVNGILENVEYFYGPDGSIQQRVAESMKSTMKRMSKRELEESKERLFRNYLKLISN